MGFRIGKSIRVTKGVRLNVSKTGVGMSVGTKGMRYSMHSSGRRTTSVGIPGSGVRYVKSSGGGGGPRPASQPSASALPPPPAQGIAQVVKARRPGLFASKGEKALHQAIAADDPARISAVAREFPEQAIAAGTVVGLKFASENHADQAKKVLSSVFDSRQEPAHHPFIKKYLPALGYEVGIAPGVSAFMLLSRDSLGLLLAEVHQATDDVSAAIDVVEQLEPTSTAAVSLAELYSEAGRHADVVELTEGVANDDDATALLCVFRGIAFREQGFNDAAREAFKEALKTKKREPVIRHRALLERARTYVAEGKKAQAKKDLERIMAEDSDYEGLAGLLGSLGN